MGFAGLALRGAMLAWRSVSVSVKSKKVPALCSQKACRCLLPGFLLLSFLLIRSTTSIMAGSSHRFFSVCGGCVAFSRPDVARGPGQHSVEETAEEWACAVMEMAPKHPWPFAGCVVGFSSMETCVKTRTTCSLLPIVLLCHVYVTEEWASVRSHRDATAPGP